MGKRKAPPEPDFAAFLCSDCNQWVALCDECIEVYPMGQLSYCCREMHKSTQNGPKWHWLGTDLNRPLCKQINGVKK